MRVLSVLAAAVVMVALGSADRHPGQSTPLSTPGKASLLQAAPAPQAKGVQTPFGVLPSQSAAAEASAADPDAVPSQYARDASSQPTDDASALPVTEVPQGPLASPVEAQSAQPSGALLSQAADIPRDLVASLPLLAGTDVPAAPQGQAALTQPAPATGAPQQPQATPGKPALAPGEKPPRVAEYYWYAGEPKDGLAVIGYGHPKRQRGGEFLIGFDCKVGSGKATFVMFEAGSSRNQFTKGQKVAVTLEVGATRTALDGVIDSNEGSSFPRASGTISADDALFKVMDDDVKVLRVDVDGWSAAVQLILIKDVMPAFTKACAKKPQKKPEATAKAPPAAIPAKTAPAADGKPTPNVVPAQAGTQ